MSTETAPSDLPGVVDPFEYLQIKLNPDGTLNRDRFNELLPHTAATPDPADPDAAVLCKDIPLNPSLNTWVRIFLPRHATSSPCAEKLPLMVYYHGGGFIVCSAASAIFQNFCNTLCLELSAIIVSLEYRLAPEHRLPAAYDDAVEALSWIKTSQDEWLTNHANLSSCYLMGSSAGANIVYHTGLRVAAAAATETRDDNGDVPLNLEPLKIRGLILHHAFFGGAERTPSELRLGNNPKMPVTVNDLMWELSLPIGADCDHEYCNPMAAGGSSKLGDAVDAMRSLGWKVLVAGCEGDMLIDRQVAVAKLLEEKGVCVVSDFREGGYHGIELMEPDKNKALIETLKNFISNPKGRGGIPQ